LKKGSVYSKSTDVKVRKKNSEFTFKRKLNSFLPTFTDIFYGKLQNLHVISNGKYVLYFKHKDLINRALFMDYTSKAKISFQYPKLGKPYSNEFNKRLYDKVEYSAEGCISRFTVHYSSKEIKGLKFKNIFELSANGILKNWLDFEYNGKMKSDKLIQMKYGFGMQLAHSMMHYQGNLVETKTDVKNGAYNWDGDKLTEPWLFSKQNDATIGIVWNQENQLQFGDWEKFFDFKLGKMNSGEKNTTKPMIYSINTFQNYSELRNFAMKQNREKEKSVESLHFEINNGNPFIKGDISFSVCEYKSEKVKGNITIKSQKSSFKTFSKKFIENKKLIFDTHLSKENRIDIAEMKAELESLKFSRKKVFFPIGKGKVKYTQNDDSHKVCNGIISLKASDTFAPVVYSMKYKGNEWLDSPYPSVSSKSWWNPWIGGIYLSPPRVKEKSLLQEKYAINFVSKKDKLGNEWSGLCIEYSITKNENLKGLKVKQYFMLLPDTPVTYCVTEINQNTGRYISNQYLHTACFVKPDETKTDSSLLLKADNCEDIEIVAGMEMQNRQTKKSAVFKSANRNEILQIKSVSDFRNIYVMMDPNVISAWPGDFLKAKNGETVFLNPHFYIVNDEIIEDSVLADLWNVKFE
ncbi:MAG: hypothetical protein PF570_07925, partial [Candidatus Cloacimonetes bacterium]|nr:hypothetical protein [Candidatus Cloacimonadota bacterium]